MFGAAVLCLQVTLEQFTRVLTDKMEEESSMEELAQAFRMFEPANGSVITPADLKRISTELGENMTTEELGEMIEEAVRLPYLPPRRTRCMPAPGLAMPGPMTKGPALLPCLLTHVGQWHVGLGSLVTGRGWQRRHNGRRVHPDHKPTVHYQVVRQPGCVGAPFWLSYPVALWLSSVSLHRVKPLCSFSKACLGAGSTAIRWCSL